MNTYIGMVSSDWSQCLSPSGPFDAFIFHYPEIEVALQRIFKQYTANEISLSRAADQVKETLPSPLTAEQMDEYLDVRFEVYKGVDQLIHWCHQNDILFMINTTGFMGYFQRLFSQSRLPPVTALSAQPMLKFSTAPTDPEKMVTLFEIEDKAANTAAMARMHHIPSEKIILMGDSGGDGPHFEWGARVGATLIGSMTKCSLNDFCRQRGIKIDHFAGHTYAAGEAICLEKERLFDYGALSKIIGRVVGIK